MSSKIFKYAVSIFKCPFELYYFHLSLFLQFEPVVHPEAAAHVHHMILYVCDDLDAAFDQLTPEQLDGGPCYTGAAHPALAQCIGQTIIAAWAVGGQVKYNTVTHGPAC